MNEAATLLGFAFVASLLGAPLAGASATCDGGQFLARYDYCVFDAASGGDGGSAASTATLARGSFAASQPGTSMILYAKAVEDHERTSGGETTQRDTSGVGASGKLVYRTSYNVTVGGGQERTDGPTLADQRSSVGLAAHVDDPLLQRLGARATYDQRAADGACVQTLHVQVSLISDVIGFAPSSACPAALPWTDAGRVSATAASALP